MIDPQFWEDELVVFPPAPHSDRDGSEEPGLDALEDQHTEEIIASLADPGYAREWLAHNDELHELLYQQRRAAEKKLAKALTLAALWRHTGSPVAHECGTQLLETLTGK